MRFCRFPISRALLSQIVAVFFFTLLFFAAKLSISQLSLFHPQPLSLPPAESKPSTALVATLDGTMYLVESASGRVIWSFSTGPPIYHSYQAPINNAKENLSGLIECGDDWELIIHDKRFGKMRLSKSIADYVAVTPTVSEDGAVILGSKRSTVFEVDAKTGMIIRRYAASDLDNASTGWSDDGRSVTTFLDIRNNELADSIKLSSSEFLLKIFRTDYFLQSVGPKSGMVLWTMAVAEFKAVLLCRHSDNPSGTASLDAEWQYASDRGLDFAMPYTCHDKKLKEVYRQRKNFLLEPSNPERLSEDYQESDMLPMPSSHLLLPSQPNIDRFLPGPDGMMMLHTPMPNYLPSLPPIVGFYDNNDNAALVPQPPMEMSAPGVDLGKVIEWSTALPLVVIMVFSFCFLIFYQHQVKFKHQVKLKDQNSASNSKSSPAKKKRTRKSGRNLITVDKQDKHLSSPIIVDKQGDRLSSTQEDSETNKVDGRRIGKLFVSNKEIAKGSNGTIVLEGMYEGREVAVKRLVRAHHDVANKEIQNLIASDRHPNIVRWYGVENDHDFVYLALERCTCSLDDLIQNSSDVSENPIFGKDQASKISLKAQIQTGKGNIQYLWKENDHPSPLLLKLMRDIVSGLVHLHELGIVHRDLKPQNVLIQQQQALSQNVLITTEKSLCAKLSDMGISKCLPEDMSSLGDSTTGCGSTGWQAPEQLVRGRQTRAVDLFCLGCVLFFCVTRGRHPFGDRLERDVNIVKNRKDLFLVKSIPEAEYLISCLLNPGPNLRPTAIEVLHNPLFWSFDTRISFLRDASDRVELEDRERDSDLLKALESIAPVALGAKWDEKVGPAFITNLGRYRRYRFDSVRDLLRAMRNKLNHYRDMPQELQELVGPVPEGFYNYFASRFPRLLIEVYRVIHKYCKEEDCFQRYFRGMY